MANPNEPMRCHQCGQTFQSKELLQQHLRQHQGAGAGQQPGQQGGQQGGKTRGAGGGQPQQG